MDEGSINFKALRAKFQEEASLARSKASRPAVAEKPKQLPPSGAHCCSVVSSINGAVEHRTPALPRVVFRDGLQASAGKRPISFPPKVQQTPPSFQCANGDTATRQSLRERHMPLVLPFIPVKEHKSELPATRELKLEEELGKEAVLQSKIKKKGLLLPFKASKAARISGENGEEPPYSDLTVRPSSAPGELPSVEKQPVEDGLSVQRDPSTAEFLVSSPDIPDTPSPADTSVESDNKILSTLEKAKKKLSCRQMLISAKSLCSPDHASKEKAFPSPPQKAEPELPIPSPVCLPNLSCLSARPFFKTNNSAQKSPLGAQFGKNKAETLPVRTGLPSSVPLKKPSANLRLRGPAPLKPPRPPLVDLSRFHLHTFNAVPPSPRQEPEAESTSVVIEAPEFPDFDHSEMEAAEDEAVDIGALDLEAIDFPPSLPPFSLCQPVEPLMSSDMESHLEPPSLPDPMSISEFPEPPVSELWSQSEEVSLEPQSHTDEAERGAADDVTQPAPDSHPSCCEAGDNVYEDVENVKKLIMEQNSRKRKAGLRNPYADSHSTDGAGLHTWPRHPRKERQSPHTAEYKEQKKREKQRLEKEKKEQREREKKENEMKKKFKVTGEEEPMYHARVMVASKVRKNDLPVKNGDTVGIIRTTSCPKGKWLARDANNRYGYISVMNVELNIKEMLELGKKAQAAGRGGTQEGDTISIGSRSSNQPVLTSSFTDDSEEWACEDETISFSNDFPPHTSSMAETSCGHVSTRHTLSDANLEDLHTQSRHEALQKLAIFFQHSKDEFADVPDGEGATPTNSETTNFLSAVQEPPFPDQKVDFTELELFPPPPLYADTNVYKRVVTPRRAGLAVVMCWTVAFIVGLTPMLGWNNLRRLQQNGSISSDLVVTCQFENVISMDYMVYFNFFGWVLPPLLLMLVIYAEIFYMIHKQLNNKKIISSYSDPNKYYNKELNLAKSLALVLLLFAISWLPLHIINCITLFCPDCQKPIVLLYIAILLTHGNSAVNPIVYAFRIQKFRVAFRKIWQQYFCCRNTPALEIQLSDRKEMPSLMLQAQTPLQLSQDKIPRADPTRLAQAAPEQQQNQSTEPHEQPQLLQ